MKAIVTILALTLIVSSGSLCQSSNQYDAANFKAVYVHNINGDIKVEKSNSQEIAIEYKNIRTEKRFKIHEFVVEDTLIITVEVNDFQIDDMDFSYDFPKNIKANSCDYNDFKRPHYDIYLKVPSRLSVKVSTINDGDIYLKDISGEVDALNVNGSLKLTNVAHVNRAITVNGDVDIDFVRNPNNSFDVFTVNGDINLEVLNGFNSEISFDSLNGDFYTNANEAYTLPTKIEKINKGKLTLIKDVGSNIQIGEGGIHITLKTLNGDAIVNLN